METELRKLPKDILIEIIKKGFDMEYLSKEELNKIYKESKEKLSKKMQESNFNMNKDKGEILSESDDHKIVIEWGWKGKVIKMYLELLYEIDTIVYISFISIHDSKIGFDADIFSGKIKFENFATLIKIVEKRIIELRDCYKVMHAEINWELLREMYDDCLIWNELAL